jgi:hypothetical protein
MEAPYLFIAGGGESETKNSAPGVRCFAVSARTGKFLLQAGSY